MRRIATFSIFQVDQPGDWEAACRFAVPPLWRSLGELMFQAKVGVGSPEYRQLREGLAALHVSSGVESSETIEEILDAADYAAADFVWILGAYVDRLAVKGRTGRTSRCDLCGSGHVFSAERLKAIREERLDGPGGTENELPPPPGGWDFANLPTGLLVSERVTQWFRQWNLTGWETLPLISATTRAPSTRAHILRATTFLPTPCLEHSEEGTEVCPGCGVVRRGAIHESFWMKKKDVSGLSMWSQDAARVHSIYLRRSVVDRLREVGANGMHPLHAVRVCDHA